MADARIGGAEGRLRTLQAPDTVVALGVGVAHEELRASTLTRHHRRSARLTVDRGRCKTWRRGIHHIGFYVDDEQETAKHLREANFSPVPIPKSANSENRMAVMGDADNLKYLGPDDVQLDIRSRGWNEAISFAMPRYELAPAEEKEAAE